MGLSWKELQASLDRIGQSGKIAVVGDLMLDHYISGRVNRISPEAPVPVVTVDSERFSAGGAGNVIANLQGLGVAAAVFGRVGRDSQGEMLQNILSDGSRRLAELCLIRRGKTVEKVRILGNGRQQIVRLDRERKELLSPEEEQEILEKLEAIAGELALLILSDYDKGIATPAFCRSLRSFCARQGILFFLDPKTSDWERYRGADLVTPNITELSAVAGCAVPNEDEAVLEWGQKILRRFDLKNLLVTRSEKGATFISEGLCFHESAVASDIYDVSGAGDTMIATVAACRAAAMDWQSCLYCANMAAQVVIGKVGTCPITMDELRLQLQRHSGEESFKGQAKVVDAAEAARLCRLWQAQGKRVIFTNGCFDLFHAGHVSSLTHARSLGDKLIVAVNSDDSIRRLKGPRRPINSLDARMAVLSALEAVDLVVPFGEDTPEQLLSLVRPSVIAKGADYSVDRVAGWQFAEEVAILPLKPGFSSSGILARLNGERDNDSP